MTKQTIGFIVVALVIGALIGFVFHPAARPIIKLGGASGLNSLLLIPSTVGGDTYSLAVATSSGSILYQIDMAGNTSSSASTNLTGLTTIGNLGTSTFNGEVTLGNCVSSPFNLPAISPYAYNIVGVGQSYVSTTVTSTWGLNTVSPGDMLLTSWTPATGTTQNSLMAQGITLSSEPVSNGTSTIVGFTNTRNVTSTAINGGVLKVCYFD